MESVLRVRESADWILSQASHIKIDESRLEKLFDELKETDNFRYGDWQEYHFKTEGVEKERLIAFVCIIDSINFCFWPSKEKFEYDELIDPWRKAIRDADSNLFRPQFLSEITDQDLENLYG